MRSLKILLLILGITTALSLIFAGPIPVFLQWYNPHMWLGQSAWGMENFFLLANIHLRSRSST